jgi:hypothetical protein
MYNPNADSLTYNDVWFYGHSRFVEANASIRKSSVRNLGGFPLDVSIGRDGMVEITEIARVKKEAGSRGALPATPGSYK